MHRSPSPDPPPSLRKRIVDRTAVATFACLWTLAFFRFAPALLALHSTAEGPANTPLAEAGLAAGISAAVVAGYLIAELVAGAVHWLADRHFDPSTPGLGPMLIAPFRAHHDDPLSIARHGFFEVLGNNALVTIPAVALLLRVPVPGPGDGVTRLALATALSATLFAVATNLFHAWAHAPAPPRIARLLQRRGLILSPVRHAIHHRGAHDRAYCVTSGWLNPLLDRLQVWARLDAWIAHSRSHPTPERTAPR